MVKIERPYGLVKALEEHAERLEEHFNYVMDVEHLGTVIDLILMSSQLGTIEDSKVVLQFAKTLTVRLIDETIEGIDNQDNQETE